MKSKIKKKLSNKELCLELATTDAEDEIVDLLKEAGYWDNKSAWQLYGDQENNFSSIGNQQSSPDAALVEKIINSVDAVLMRECLRRQIKPDGKEAPDSIAKALKYFFNIFEGKLSNLEPKQRAEVAENILLVATGKKSNPSFEVIDMGEGQTPEKMPNTLLSLGRSNKLRIPFVQGKFNMGATGSFQFCGKRNMQLIISKRDPLISKNENEPSKDEWSFTVIRREYPKEGMRSSTFKYLSPNKKLLSFRSDSGLPLLPKDYPNPYGNLLKWGTFIKLYEYQLRGYRTLIKFDLYYRLSLLMPNVALPFTMYERRKGYTSRSYHIVNSGLSVRLEEDKSENLEDGFPGTGEINIQGQEMKILIYAFKRGKREKYAKREGIIFLVNGQAHGYIGKEFFERKNVGMQYLSDSILLLIDCSKVSGEVREDLFMNSRDRLREGDLQKEIEKQLEELIRNHSGLRELRERRRREDIEDKLQDSKPLAEALENIIKKSPSLTKLFVAGVRIINPFKVSETIGETKFKPEKYPSYFKLKKNYEEKSPKICPINKRYRIQFLTDAENDYFNRDKDPGEFTLRLNGEIVENYSLNLWNGIANLNVELPAGSQIGEVLYYTSSVNDINCVKPFDNSFFVKIADPEKSQPDHEKGKRKSGGKRKEGEKKTETTSYLDLPNIREVRQNEWERFGFKDSGALKVMDSGESGYDFFINLDNVYLQTEIKGSSKIDPRLLEARYKYGMVLLGISMLDFYNKREDKDKESGSLYEKIATFTSAVSPVLLPMIASLGDIDVE